MHLTDRCRRKRLLLKVLQLVSPVGTEVAADGFLQRQNGNILIREPGRLTPGRCRGSPFRTVICLDGMKSALWRTRSKILASWGLMKASSERGKQRAQFSLLLWCVNKLNITMFLWMDASILRTNQTSTYVRYWYCRDTQTLEMRLQAWHTEGFIS